MALPKFLVLTFDSWVNWSTYQTDIIQLVEPILKRSPETQGGEKLLHLAVSSSSTLKSNTFAEDDSSAAASSLFPSVEVADFILKVDGGSLAQRQKAGSPRSNTGFSIRPRFG